MTNFKVNGAVWDSFLADDLTETPRRMSGPNGGQAINGDTIFDFVSRKYDIKVSTRPLNPSQLAVINQACGGATLPVTFFSPLRNQTVTQYCVIEISAAKRLFSRTTGEIYDVAELTFTEA